MEFYEHKKYYIFFIFSVFLVFGYAWIGAPAQQKDIINFYFMYFGVPFLFLFLIDLFTEKQFEDIQTTTIDEPHEHLEWLSPKIQILVGIAFGALIFWKIAVTGSAFVDTIRFGIFEGVWGNALLSALVGVIEDWVFFGAVFPSVLSFTNKRFQNVVFAFLLAAAVATASFTSYHNWRYGFSETAMLSVAVFSIINCIVVYATQSLIISDAFHAFNNAAVTLGFAKRIALAVVL